MRDRMASQARAGIAHGGDPQHADFWQHTGIQQVLVDAAFLAQALLRAPGELWDPLDADVKSCLIQFFKSLRDRAPFFNNWLLFSACTEAFLASIGEDWDRMRVDYAIRQHEQWYLGDGTYADGPEFHHDYYNSFVIQPMLHEILEVVAPLEERWAPFAEPVRKRLARHAELQERHINSDGTWPLTGRSITYRTGALHGLAFAAWKQLLPPQLPPSQVRCALTAVIQRGLYPENNYDSDGWLWIGVNGHQPSLGEHYITTASLYLATFVFAPLGLFPAHPFWSDPDRAWTARRVWQLGEDIPADHALKGKA